MSGVSLMGCVSLAFGFALMGGDLLVSDGAAVSLGVTAAELVGAFALSSCARFRTWTLLGGRVVQFSPSKTSRSNSIAVISSIGAFFGCCLMAVCNCLAASRIRSAGVSCGIAMA